MSNDSIAVVRNSRPRGRIDEEDLGGLLRRDYCTSRSLGLLMMLLKIPFTVVS
jgi:hypothetical protein